MQHKKKKMEDLFLYTAPHPHSGPKTLQARLLILTGHGNTHKLKLFSSYSRQHQEQDNKTGNQKGFIWKAQQ